MKDLLILGAGTGGTTLANRMRRRLGREWRVRVVDPAPTHVYQPGLLFLPFGMTEVEDIVRPREGTLAAGVEWVRSEVAGLDGDRREVELVDGQRLRWDLLVIASGCELRPELTPGLEGEGWREQVHEFYSLAGARALRDALARFQGGRLVIAVVEPPIKCPVAPLELACLADDALTQRGLRERTELVFVTPQPTLFAKPLASERVTRLLEQKGVRIETGLATSSVDGGGRVLRASDGSELEFDLLVAVPAHRGARFVDQAGLGRRGYVATDRATLAVAGLPDAFAMGDVTDLPTSKAGSVAHFQADVLSENLERVIAGAAPEPTFDGHANCFIETGHGKAMLLDFNYDTEPLLGRFPTPWGPFTLLEESRRNHWAKVAFRWLYWSALLPGRPLPLAPQMSMSGKRRPGA